MGDRWITEEELQQLRSEATALLLREDWEEYIHLYSTFIQRLVSLPNQQTEDLRSSRCLCMALCNRAEARLRLRDPSGALEDCDQALVIDPNHLKALVCRGKALLDLDCYSGASGCFRRALDVPATEGNPPETLRPLLKRCERLEAQSRTGAIELSDWVLSGFRGKPPELAEFVGPVEIKRSGDGAGRGIFATKNIEAGTPLIVTKAVAIGRGILPEPGFGSDNDNGRIVLWKDFVDKLLEAAARSSRTLRQIYSLSTGVDEDGLAIPEMGLFRPGAEETRLLPEEVEEPDTGRILRILDVNCLTEEGPSAKALGKNRGCCGVGLWLLPSLVNHACNPNARRLHVGDHVLVHASRDVKAGEEITFAYFDVLRPLKKRREVMSRGWGFQCRCQRCRVEDWEVVGDDGRRQQREKELAEMEMDMAIGSSDAGGVVVVARLEEWMRRWMVKEKGFLRASFWSAYSRAFSRPTRRTTIPTEAVVARSVWEAVGGDERILKMAVKALKKGSGRGGSGAPTDLEEIAMRMGRSVYGKVMRKKQSQRALLELACAG